MSEIVTRRPVYDLTVRDFFAHFAKSEDQKLTELLLKMPVVKSIRVQPGEQTKTINASGIVYDTVTQLNDPKIGLNVVSLPREFVDRALGAAGIGAVRYDVDKPHKEEFSCGYWAEKSDGSAVYYYHPRCKLIQGDEDVKTSESGQLPDPSVSYDVLLLPTDEGVWRVRYDTGAVDAGKVPLTPEEFFKMLPGTIEEILAIPEGEKTKQA